MKRLLSFFAAALALVAIAGHARAQGFSFNNTGATANASAIMDVSSTTQGILIPRMTAAQRALIASPATGLLVYQTDGTAGFWFYDGSAWTSLNGGVSGSAGGDLSGSYPNPTLATTATAGANAVAAINASSSTINAARLGSGTSITTKYLRGDNTWQNLASGSVTSVSAGVLTSGTTAFQDTLFRSVVINPTTTPAIFYSFNNACPNCVLTNSMNYASIPVYAKVVPNTLWASSGTPTTTTFYRGDGSWQAPFTLSTSGAGPASFSGTTLTIPSSRYRRVGISNINSPYSVTSSDDIVGVDVTAGPVTVNLPSANSLPGGTVVIVKNEFGNAAVNNITVQRSGTDLINAASTSVTISSGTGLNALRFYTDGISRWHQW